MSITWKNPNEINHKIGTSVDKFDLGHYYCSFEYNPPGGREKESQKTCTFLI